ncbi:universal stress protein [Paraburkholderia fungorum]|uniref:Universal stress protein n=1 Tax=Paraburkholderia fungorum TaxID=134537 RepID=A0AAW3UXM7_9BURK|nr:universal stress protein [Paraburkholderia fungorum]MBB4514964.1 nucleotide-binding universal stress UspA family protein [Paraburkholderia fungorum]MBB6202908.1 nucleotide-binding universal stress UspA family protein [Paraburkholderia fungorum]MBU7442239.1 universal stress protein [Paraburkholderia fungorum]USU18186.1 universal stress protein [Paraburkholderia fungorum]USU26130.1 universal stress protein [Paraburkholderia fungorum]
MYTNILVAVDGSEASKRAVSEAIQLAKLSRCTLTAVYVIDQSAAFTYAGACDPHLLTDAARQVGVSLLNGALAQMRELNVVGDTEIVETQGIAEDIASALMRCAERRGVDLVVMGTHGRRGLRRMVIGSVAERFVRHATCPVLLIREPADRAHHASHHASE